MGADILHFAGQHRLRLAPGILEPAEALAISFQARRHRRQQRGDRLLLLSEQIGGGLAVLFEGLVGEAQKRGLVAAQCLGGERLKLGLDIAAQCR